MENENNSQKLNQHESEMRSYIDIHSVDFDSVLYSSVIEVMGRRCMIIISSQSFDDVTFDVNEAIQTILDQTHANFGIKQNFTDIDGEDYGHITVWSQPNIKINSSQGQHQIKKLLVLEYIEPGHEVENVFKILI